MASHGVKTAAVIGAGVMGSAIAAHLAGAGIPTLLLDIVPAEASDPNASRAARNRLAETGLARALAAKPALFYDEDAARLVSVGNLDDDLERLRSCDLVIEAVTENMKIKQALFEKLTPFLAPHAVLASNTSGLSLAAMAECLPPDLQQRFLVTHFFNPVRYMKLLELVSLPQTDPAVTQRMIALGEFLGKGIVYCKDTPNFVANRIGVFAMMLSIHEMQRAGLSIEQADAILGRPMGRPKSAAFQTADLVGLDTLIHVANNCYEHLVHDEEREVFKVPEFVLALARSGRLGRKSAAGFYKKVGDQILVLDLASNDYRPQAKVRFDSIGALRNLEDPGERLAKLVWADDAAAQFAWQVLSRTLCYAARRLGEIADDVLNIDRAMRWGFNWDLGPFEAWDAIGVERSLGRMRKDGLAVPAWVEEMLASGRKSFYSGGTPALEYYDPKQKLSVAIRRPLTEISLGLLRKNVVKQNAGASLVDLGDGALCIEAHTKMNTLDPDVIAMFDAAVDVAEQNFEAIVIANDGQHFCAGANLMLIAMAAMQKQWDKIEHIIITLQNALSKLRHARVPVVAAPFQYTLGGGCEVALAADACQAHAETYMGLVEVGVGLIPAGGGCLRMVERSTQALSGIAGIDLLPPLAQAWQNIAMAKASTGAEQAVKLGYLRATDGISLNRDQLLYHAKSRALGMARAGYRPNRPLELRAVGYDAAKTLGARTWGMVEGRYASEHDALIANKLAHVMCGGTVAEGTPLSEQHYLDLEREAFLSLCGEKKTHERVEHMLKNGKPLRN